MVYPKIQKEIQISMWHASLHSYRQIDISLYIFLSSHVYILARKTRKTSIFFTEARWWLHCTYYKQLDRLHIPIFYWLFLNTQLSTLYTSQTTISCMICYTELKLPGLLFIKRGDTTILEECCCYAPHHSCNFLHDILQFKKLTKQKQSVTNFILKRINKIINNFNTPLNNPKCESTRRIPWKKETFSCPLEIRRLHS